MRSAIENDASDLSIPAVSSPGNSSRNTPLFSRVTIVAPGLLGGSLALAFRQHGLAGTVVGVARRQETIDEGLERGAFDIGTLNGADGVRGANLLVIGAPVRATIEILSALAPSLPENCLVTDLGSTKRVVMDEALRILGPGRFVGGHPMAGSHESGIAAARAGLFEDARYLLTHDGQTAFEHLEKMEQLARAIGARPLWLDAEDHDALVARISHLPHVAACALVECAEDYTRSGISALSLAAAGFRDTTRIAAGHPAMWSDICLTNKGPLIESLDSFVEALAGLRQRIVEGDEAALSEWLTAAGMMRRRIE